MYSLWSLTLSAGIVLALRVFTKAQIVKKKQSPLLPTNGVGANTQRGTSMLRVIIALMAILALVLLVPANAW